MSRPGTRHVLLSTTIIRLFPRLVLLLAPVAVALAATAPAIPATAPAPPKKAEQSRFIKLEVRGEDLVLPDHYVFIARGSFTTLTSSIPLLDTLSELRAAHPCSLGLTQLKIVEQEDYVKEALARVDFSDGERSSGVLA